MKVRTLLAAVLVASSLSTTLKADYHLERITGILNQPTYVTQAPGDPTNILYYTTRITGNNSGFGGTGGGTTNKMGSVWRYDTVTRTSIPVLNLSSNRIVQSDTGLQCIAFHPNFNILGDPGYGKLYVSSAQKVSSGGPTNRVEEYLLNPTNAAVTNGAVFQRLLLAYLGNSVNNHTIGWIGFDTSVTNVNDPARNYLYISTADGAYGNNYNNGNFPNGRPSQNPADVRGKMLRVDVVGSNAYPADPSKNFAIPPSNPIPTYNSTHTNSLTGTVSTNVVPALGEVFLTGLRNGWRASIDRATGDIFWGDVGEVTWEEVNFVKAGSNSNGPPLDFGWPQKEGNHDSGISGAPHGGTNPFYTNISVLVPCTKPVVEWMHPTSSFQDSSTGGYVYRGPIPELQGKYFFADFPQAQLYMLDFDRNTDPATFNGSNGTVTNITALWNTLVVDTTTNDYRGDTSLATTNGIDRVVSFGEDNDGNLYLVDFDTSPNSGGIDPQYKANCGEIFKLVPGPTPPPGLSVSQAGTNVVLSWIGPMFKLQAQTNGVDPGGWGDYPGGTNSPVTNVINTSQGSVYFRLKSK